MLKKDHLKYQYYKGWGEEWAEVLFDLERDQTESINYIHDDKYQKEIDYFRIKIKEYL